MIEAASNARSAAAKHATAFASPSTALVTTWAMRMGMRMP